MLMLLTLSFYITNNFSASEPKVDFNNLRAYSIIFVSNDNGLYQYIGNNGGLSISFLMNEKKVLSVNYMFPPGDELRKTEKIVKITKNMMSQKVIDSNYLTNELLRNFNQLKEERDDESFSY